MCMHSEIKLVLVLKFFLSAMLLWLWVANMKNVFDVPLSVTCNHFVVAGVFLMVLKLFRILWLSLTFQGKGVDQPCAQFTKLWTSWYCECKRCHAKFLLWHLIVWVTLIIITEAPRAVTTMISQQQSLKAKSLDYL